MKKEKGITLIALVITIIVLLILAGVTINTLFGNEGILNKASESKIETEKSIAKEKVGLVLENWNLKKMDKSKTLKGELEENFGNENVKENEENYEVTVDNYKIVVSKDAQILDAIENGSPTVGKEVEPVVLFDGTGDSEFQGLNPEFSYTVSSQYSHTDWNVESDYIYSLGNGSEGNQNMVFKTPVPNKNLTTCHVDIEIPEGRDGQWNTSSICFSKQLDLENLDIYARTRTKRYICK